MQKLLFAQPVITLWTSGSEANLAGGGSGVTSEIFIADTPIERLRVLIDLNGVANDIALQSSFDGVFYDLYRLDLSAAITRNISALIHAPVGTHLRFLKAGPTGAVASVRVQYITSNVFSQA